MITRMVINRPCIIHRLTVDSNERDDMGDPIASDSTASTVCELQQFQTNEYRSGQNIGVALYTLFLKPDETLDGWSELTIAPVGVTADTWDGTGETYTVEGMVEAIRHPRTGVVHHIEATVRKVK